MSKKKNLNSKDLHVEVNPKPTLVSQIAGEKKEAIDWTNERVYFYVKRSGKRTIEHVTRKTWEDNAKQLDSKR